MNTKKRLMIIASVILAAIIIAGQTIGWGTFLSPITQIFKSPIIEISSLVRPSVNKFFAGEKIWLTLKDVETERVYWLFDEGDKMIPSGVQIQHAFPFDEQRPDGQNKYHRIDAFFKDGDKYSTASARIAITNLNLHTVIDIETEAIEIIANAQLEDKWKMKNVFLTKYANGTFEEQVAIPISIKPGEIIGRIVMSLEKVAKIFGYKPHENIKEQLACDNSAWITMEYIPRNGEETVAIVKPLGANNNQ